MISESFEYHDHVTKEVRNTIQGTIDKHYDLLYVAQMARSYTEFHCQRNFIFFISSFRYIHNWKTFVCHNHLNDPTTFLHYQNQVCSAHARIHALGYKNAFSVLPVHGLVVFQNRAQMQNL